MALLGRIRSVDAITVAQAGPGFGQVAVPNLVGFFRYFDALDFAPALIVEQAQLDFLCAFREQREIDTFAVPVGAKRIGAARPYSSKHFIRHDSLHLLPDQKQQEKPTKKTQKLG